MEGKRKKSVQEKVTELQTQIKKLKMKSERCSSKKAASLNSVKDKDQKHPNDVFTKGDIEFSSGDEMIIKLNDLDLSNEETWLYIPEKSPTGDVVIGTTMEAKQNAKTKKIPCA